MTLLAAILLAIAVGYLGVDVFEEFLGWRGRVQSKCHKNRDSPI